MAITQAELKEKLSTIGIAVFPEGSRLVCALPPYTFACSLESEGAFLYFRSISQVRCAATHPHLDAVLRALGQLNYRYRVVKFCWDPSDGEIVFRAEHWLQDNTLTEDQLRMMVRLFIGPLKSAQERLTRCLETGQDHGEAPSPETPRPQL